MMKLAKINRWESGEGNTFTGGRGEFVTLREAAEEAGLFDVWVSVDDRLPKSESKKDSCNPYYFIWHKKFGVLKAMFMGTKWYTSYSSRVVGKVTHWMPLPAPPKKEGE